MELTNFASIVLYLAVFLAAGFLAYVGERTKKKTPIILAILLPTLLAGLRYSTGTDSMAYRTFYHEVGSETFGESIFRIEEGSMEPFMVFAALIGNAFGFGANFIFLIFALITVVFLYLTVRKISHKSAWLYFSMLLLIVFPESFNIMRQLAAVSVQAFALSYIYDKQKNNNKINLSLVLGLSAFAVILHYSSILLLPVLFLPLVIKKIRGRSLYSVLAACAVSFACAFPAIIAFVIEIGILSNKHLSTILGYGGELINVKFIASIILTAIFLVNYLRRGLPRDKFMCFLMLVGAVYTSIGFYSGYVGRIGNFFWIFIIIAMTDLIGQLAVKKYPRIIISLLIGVFYLVVYFGLLGFDAVVPYVI
jgi:hypothetical protein